MIPGFVLWLLIRRHYDVLRRSVTAICLTFFVSYPLFFLYPVEGPRWHFAGAYTHDITGPVFRPLVEFVIANGAVRGGCVPSTHTAVAIVIMMFCFKYYRRAGWLLLPVNICLAIGTFWGRYHYISDVVIGIVIAVVSTIVVWRYYDRWDRTPMELIRSKKVPVTHAA
jgi:membrane-associated phospholipid phosphatase